MTFSLLKPDFTKYFNSETKYSIAITADDSVTKKFPVLEDGPLEVALFWRTQFDELAQLKNFDAANKFTNVLLLLSGDAKDKWINARNDDNFRMNTRYGRYGAAYNMVGLLLF
jgi:hypothetical protein